ncbi:PiggyBac transposable element-derived protein 3-like [Plakobranchus ocellatus]|uniref:PiggyBac transposable element-derived protein 3-like n=1 Tax=Plakobranchus ocellatus TaxID=259542 RepID=A0AAV4AFX7_9GAST|nr:PiggyBac transposable element-derived protein 3-like [Plakobranchus ocellatus]
MGTIQRKMFRNPCVCEIDLLGRQFRSQAYCRAKYTNVSNRIIGDCSEKGPGDSDKRRGRNQPAVARPSVWRKEDLPAVPYSCNTAPPEFLQEDVTPTKCIESFFDNVVIEHTAYLDLYQGPGPGYDRKLGLGHAVVIGLVDPLPRGPRYQQYFDNFFTGFGQLKELGDRGIAATGTVRSNLTEKCPIDVKSLKKSRGDFLTTYKIGKKGLLFTHGTATHFNPCIEQE